jgi:hypothetical protein
MKARVYSSWGEFEIDVETGKVLKWSPYKEVLEKGEFNNARIFEFDMVEWKAFYPKIYVADYLESRGDMGFDILDLGYKYWFMQGNRIKRNDPDDWGYQAPELRWRAELGHVAQAGNLAKRQNAYELLVSRVARSIRLQRAVKAPFKDTTLLKSLATGALAQVSREIGLWDCSIISRHETHGDLLFYGPKGAAITLNPLMASVGHVRKLARMMKGD